MMEFYLKKQINQGTFEEYLIPIRNLLNSD